MKKLLSVALSLALLLGLSVLPAVRVAAADVAPNTLYNEFGTGYTDNIQSGFNCLKWFGAFSKSNEGLDSSSLRYNFWPTAATYAANPNVFMTAVSETNGYTKDTSYNVTNGVAYEVKIRYKVDNLSEGARLRLALMPTGTSAKYDIKSATNNSYLTYLGDYVTNTDWVEQTYNFTPENYPEDTNLYFGFLPMHQTLDARIYDSSWLDQYSSTGYNIYVDYICITESKSYLNEFNNYQIVNNSNCRQYWMGEFSKSSEGLDGNALKFTFMTDKATYAGNRFCYMMPVSKTGGYTKDTAYSVTADTTYKVTIRYKVSNLSEGARLKLYMGSTTENNYDIKNLLLESNKTYMTTLGDFVYNTDWVVKTYAYTPSVVPANSNLYFGFYPMSSEGDWGATVNDLPTANYEVLVDYISLTPEYKFTMSGAAIETLNTDEKAGLTALEVKASYTDDKDASKVDIDGEKYAVAERGFLACYTHEYAQDNDLLSSKALFSDVYENDFNNYTIANYSVTDKTTNTYNPGNAMNYYMGEFSVKTENNNNYLNFTALENLSYRANRVCFVTPVSKTGGYTANESYRLKSNKEYEVKIRYKVSDLSDKVNLKLTLAHTKEGTYDICHYDKDSAYGNVEHVVNSNASKLGDGITNTNGWVEKTYSYTPKNVPADSNLYFGFYPEYVNGGTYTDICGYTVCVDYITITEKASNYSAVKKISKTSDFGDCYSYNPGTQIRTFSGRIGGFESTSTKSVAACAYLILQNTAGNEIIKCTEPVIYDINRSENISLLERSGYSLVWGDEFDGASLDSTKWSIKKINNQSASDKKVLTDGSLVNLSNGKMTLSTVKNGDGTYSYPANVNTLDSMLYNKGYLEVRAKLPEQFSSSATLWLRTDPGVKMEAAGEVDIFENFGVPNTVTPNLHIWKNSFDESGNYTGSSDIAWNINAENTQGVTTFTEYNQFHTFGFEWTASKMMMYIDGVKTVEYNLTDGSYPNYQWFNKNYGVDADTLISDALINSDMGIVLGSGLFTSLSGTRDDVYNADKTDKPLYFPFNFEIDYVRLYQTDNCSINLK